MSLEKNLTRICELPEIIQGGMGVSASDWRMAKAVAAEGGLGIVSGTAIGLVLARRLQNGDLDMVRGLKMFPDQEIAKELLHEYYLPGGRAEDQPFKYVPRFTDEPSALAEKLNVAGAFVETKLAKEHGGTGIIGINLLLKIQPQTPSIIYGAMLAGAEAVFAGAGIGLNMPETIDSLAMGKPVDYRIYVENETMEHYVHFDPNKYKKPKDHEIKRPFFGHIISVDPLAKKLASYDKKPDGFVIERNIAGGHNAKARGKELDKYGQPIYGIKDEANLIVMNELDLPYYMAGGYGDPIGLPMAIDQGANGIQVGTAFENCIESGITPEIKMKMIKQALGKKGISVYTDPLASPSGYSFKVAGIEGTLSEDDVYASRERVCDLGILADPYEIPGENNKLGWRCPAEPIESYLRKGGELAKTIGRKCLCNGLSATVGGAQIRQIGAKQYVEPPIITAGDDINRVIRELTTKDNPNYSAADVMDYLRSKS